MQLSSNKFTDEGDAPELWYCNCGVQELSI